ncbi:LysM peptidoglycan-binding domain-containing protein [Lactiplantibacillus garii]|uniref:LysM peptidoglycan-binding domain-containing protein n=1 Tax=Lactiplantibacillus garii TaxID=2306423 RepID=A0A3R8J656_9LACO|nr:LysM peptidoglycan-binding domain-containing protein [Lactiplantibacillus garii]RRK10004.1 LysM peptidoglycan-binding domain-containing protein [Lactiplantibacillus garii]
MKKLLTTALTTSVAAAALLFAGATSADAATTYTVKSGDSVWAISQKFNTTMSAVETANNISNHTIHPGETLTIGGSNATSTTSSKKTTTTSTSSSSSSTYTGSNLKSYVLSQMESRTGVSASTWNTIITRESNWQPNVVNSSSGAYGLFQNMHISSGSVEAQVDAAVALYNAQGMAAWAL